MKKLNLKNKILISILFVICLFLLKNGNKVNAASYIWPVGGENYEETYIEYWYQDRNYDATAYDKKYNYAPYEQPYSAYEPHYGVDITGVKGNNYELISICNGKVVATSADLWWYAGTNFIDRNQRRTSQGSKDGGGYGNYIVIQDSSNGKCFMYAHLKAGSITLKNGDTVTKGQKIGVMGSSGDSGHMHLHFEVRKNKNAIVGANGCYIVSKTGYNKETENPVDYIGEAPVSKEIENVKPNPDKNQNMDSGENQVPDINSGENQVPEQKPDENQMPDTNVNEKPEEEVKNIPAKIELISFRRYEDYRIIHINFDKPVIVQTPPTLKVYIDGEIGAAEYIGIINDDKKLEYKLDYNQFDEFTSEQIYLELKGEVIDKTDGKTVIDCYDNDTIIGSLNAYSINNITETIKVDLLGDINGDGRVNAIDASIILGLYSKNTVGSELTPEEKVYMTKADINGDSVVDVKDATLILSNYARIMISHSSNENLQNALRCDLNEDNSVTVKDYELLKEAIQINNQDLKFDLNQDNVVNEKDMLFLKKIVKEFGKREHKLMFTYF